jgi:hypothetical protein
LHMHVTAASPCRGSATARAKAISRRRNGTDSLYASVDRRAVGRR